MANVDRPNGFRPVKTLSGAPMAGAIRKYEAADRSADTTNNHGDIYIGDPVSLSSGKVLPANSNSQILGVVVAVGTSEADHGDVGPYDVSNLEKRYLSHAESGYVWVALANDMLFEVQTAADLDLVVGSAADISTDATEAHGSRVTSQSSCELVTSVNADVEVVEDVSTPDNDTTLVNARHMVIFNDIAHAQ